MSKGEASPGRQDAVDGGRLPAGALRRGMRKVSLALALPLVLAATACKGSSPVPTTPSPSASASASGAPAAVAPPALPFEAALPDGATLTASLDLVKANLPGALKLFGLSAMAEAALPQVHDWNGPALLDAIGIDGARPVTVAELAPSEEAKKAIAALRALLPAVEPVYDPKRVPPPGISTTMKAALAGVPAIVTYRVLIPAKDAKKVRAVLDGALTKGGYRAAANGQYSGSGSIAQVSGDGDMVGLDVALGDAPQVALAALAAAVHQKHGAATPLEGDTLRVAYAPEQMGQIGFLTSVLKTLGAVSGQSIDPAQRERIAYEGLLEASHDVLAATSARGARYDHIEMRIPTDPAHAATTVRIDPGPGFDGPPEDTWAPSYTVATGATADVSRPFLAGWKVPGPDGRTLLDALQFFRWARDGGNAAYLVAAPDVAIAAAVGLAEGEVAPPRPVLDKLARFGSVRGAVSQKPKGDAGAAPQDVFFGILPDGTPRAAAECVLADAAPCKTHKLSLGAVTKDGDASVVLQQEGTHFVLLRAKDAASLKVKLKADTAPPAKLALDMHDYPSMKPFDVIGRWRPPCARTARPSCLR